MALGISTYKRFLDETNLTEEEKETLIEELLQLAKILIDIYLEDNNECNQKSCNLLQSVNRRPG